MEKGKAGHLTEVEALSWLERYEDRLDEYECEYGHPGCSLTNNGPCADEVMVVAGVLEGA